MADEDQLIRSFSMFIDGAKWGTLKGNAYDVNTGSEVQIGDGIIIGVSQGVALVKIVSTGILHGRIHKLKLYCTSYSYKGDNEKGHAMGDWTFEGGKPTFVG